LLLNAELCASSHAATTALRDVFLFQGDGFLRRPEPPTHLAAFEVKALKRRSHSSKAGHLDYGLHLLFATGRSIGQGVRSERYVVTRDQRQNPFSDWSCT